MAKRFHHLNLYKNKVFVDGNVGLELYEKYVENYQKDCNELWEKYKEDLCGLTKGFFKKLSRLFICI